MSYSKRMGKTERKREINRMYIHVELVCCMLAANIVASIYMNYPFQKAKPKASQ